MTVNKVTLIGNVGKDPEIKYLDSSRLFAQFTLATTERAIRTSNGVMIPEHTEWHNLVMWGGLAKTAETYIRKGTKLFVEGRIRNRSWDDAQGIRHFASEIHVDDFEILSPRQQNQPFNNANGYPSPMGGTSFSGGDANNNSSF